MTAKTKDAALKERDKVNKAYKAVTAQLLAENRAKLPAAAAFADWLATNPGPDDRHAAVMMINNTLITVDGMEDPIPEDLHDLPPSTFHQLRAATLTKKTTTPPPKQKDDAAMITISITNHEDAARLPALLAAVMAQFGASIPSCSPAEVKKDVFAPVFAETAVAQAEAVAAPVAEPVVEPEPVVEEVQPEAVAEPAVPVTTYTDKDVLAALQAFARTPGGVPKIKEILAGFGATNLASINPGDYAAVIAAVAVPA